MRLWDPFNRDTSMAPVDESEPVNLFVQYKFPKNYVHLTKTADSSIQIEN